MTRLTLVVLALAAVTAAATAAEARDGCGRGWFYNGVTCAPQEGPPRYSGEPQTAAPRYYSEPQTYAPQRDSYGPAPYGYQQNYRQDYGPPRPFRNPNGSWDCTGRGYTFQDGQCRPYTGR